MKRMASDTVLRSFTDALIIALGHAVALTLIGTVAIILWVWVVAPLSGIEATAISIQWWLIAIAVLAYAGFQVILQTAQKRRSAEK